MIDQNEKPNDVTPVASDALLCRLRDLRKKKKQIDLQISETKNDLDAAKVRETLEKNNDLLQRNAGIALDVLNGSHMSHVAKAHNLSTTQIRFILHRFCEKNNSQAYERGCRRWDHGYYTELLEPELKWIRENAELFRHNVQEHPTRQKDFEK